MSDEKHEIVIIRRGGHGAHEEHHGGVWKIAFADFMTAMMAFFLVMWLISANDKTRATVARYFNPVKLVEATIRPQGLHDPKATDGTQPTLHDSEEGASKDGGGKDVGHKEPEGPPPNETPKGREARLDAKLRTNPFVALAEIAGEKGASDTPPKAAAHGTPPVIGRQGGSAFRDPFAPPTSTADDKDVDILEITPPRPRETAKMQVADAKNAEPAEAPAKPTAALETAKDRTAADLLKSLRSGTETSLGPDIAVRKTSEGFLVSLTDTSKFSMFSNGSAVPSRRVVVLMEQVAKQLAKRPGGVVVRGFTDNKPFKSGRYDNWSLSVDRAQAAHYMLVRGGLPDARIVGVQGFADRSAQPGADPASALNRRIEILLKEDAK